MARSFDIECPECGARLHVREDLMGCAAIGCKDRETAECPECGHVVYSAMTAGRFVVTTLAPQ